MLNARRYTRLLVPLILLASAAAWGSGPAFATEEPAPPSPTAVVESLHDALIDSMKGAGGPDLEGRYERIVAVLDEAFDLVFMAQISIGKQWRALTREQRGTYYALSRRLSGLNYASNFDGYGGQHFETLGEQPAARNTILVMTRFVQPKDDNVRFDYRLRRTDGRWKVIDVTLDGKISEITLRRADYHSVIKREGFEKLVESLEKKIATLEEE